MQRSFSLLSFQKLIIQSLFLSFLIIGCNFSKKEIDNKIIITGESETQDIQDAQEVLFLKDQFEYHRTNVNNNRFKFDLESNEVSTLEFSITMFLKFPIFAKPGDSIHVEFNEIDLKNETAPPIFSGARIVENNFFYELHQILIS